MIFNRLTKEKTSKTTTSSAQSYFIAHQNNNNLLNDVVELRKSFATILDYKYSYCDCETEKSVLKQKKNNGK